MGDEGMNIQDIIEKYGSLESWEKYTEESCKIIRKISSETIFDFETVKTAYNAFGNEKETKNCLNVALIYHCSVYEAIKMLRWVEKEPEKQFGFIKL
jgi:hypothetical protein